MSVLRNDTGPRLRRKHGHQSIENVVRVAFSGGPGEQLWTKRGYDLLSPARLPPSEQEWDRVGECMLARGSTLATFDLRPQ